MTFRAPAEQPGASMPGASPPSPARGLIGRIGRCSRYHGGTTTPMERDLRASADGRLNLYAAAVGSVSVSLLDIHLLGAPPPLGIRGRI
jgi:hypothetical protein